jgi:hypothetical protein
MSIDPFPAVPVLADHVAPPVAFALVFGDADRIASGELLDSMAAGIGTVAFGCSDLKISGAAMIG